MSHHFVVEAPLANQMSGLAHKKTFKHQSLVCHVVETLWFLSQLLLFSFNFFNLLSQKTQTFCCISASGASKTRPSSTCVTNQGALPTTPRWTPSCTPSWLLSSQGNHLEPSLRTAGSRQQTVPETGTYRNGTDAATVLNGLSFLLSVSPFLCFLKSGDKTQPIRWHIVCHQTSQSYLKNSYLWYQQIKY